MKTAWATPTLLTLSSGFEAQANKNQTFTEGSRGCAPNQPAVGCPGEEGDIEGAS